MRTKLTLAALTFAATLSAGAVTAQTPGAPDPAAYILTPPPPHTPRIVGARVYGERPGRPFLFSIPATGDDPITYGARGLPPGLRLDPKTGRITGSVTRAGAYTVTLTARNALGRDVKPLRVEIGDRIALTPPMGWNSYNALGDGVTQADILPQARALVAGGLARHGWTYINIDDAWQGARSGPDHTMQASANYPDMAGMCAAIHALGLKAGLYSTPWTTSYGGNPGETSLNAEGIWAAPTIRARFDGKTLPWTIGPSHFEAQDARQWAAWGFDYFKYDWFPNGVPETQTMADALSASGRDFVFSLSNTAPFENAADWARLSNVWRTTGDVRDTWASMLANGFSQDRWAPYAGLGHWNDPDMLVVGVTGGWANGGASKPGPNDLHPSRLTPDEQYTHISLWCLLASPLLLGCDLTKMDPFTLGLLTNDEVLAVDQDPLGKEARLVHEEPGVSEVWARPLADGTEAVGLFNMGRYEIAGPPRVPRGQPAPPPIWHVRDRVTGQDTDFPSRAQAEAQLQKFALPMPVSASWADLHLSGPQPVRDLWRQKDLGVSDGQVTATLPYHGVVLLKVGTPH